MKKITITLVLLATILLANAQTEHKIYDEKADAAAEFIKILQKASNQNKHVLIQIGGNWCPWCKRFDAFTHGNLEIDSIINAEYLVLHVNYSEENKNWALLRTLEYPQRFGFPVFVITDTKGKRLHTQNSGFLEKESSYDPDKVKQFLLQWTMEAVSKEYNE